MVRTTLDRIVPVSPPVQAPRGGPAPVRVAVYDSRPIVAEGLAALLAGTTGLDVVAAATDVNELAGAIGGLGVQVAVFGVQECHADGPGGLPALLSASAGAAGRPLGLVGVVPGGRAGADRPDAAGFGPVPGFPAVLGAVASPATLRAAVTAACPGSRPAGPPRPVHARAADPAPVEPGPAGRLTPRERDVLRGIEQGHSTREIAAALDVTVNTVRTHVQNLMPKLGVHSRLKAAALAASDPAVGGTGDAGAEPDRRTER